MGTGKPQSVTAKHLRIYLAMLATLVVPFALTFGTVGVSMTPPDLAANPTPLGYTASLSIFAVPVLAIFTWLVLNPKYRVERGAALGCVAGVFALGALLDFGFAYHFFAFPNTGSYLGVYLPAFSWTAMRFVPGYLPVEEFLFYFFGGTYMLGAYLWGTLYWFRRYNHPDHRAEVRSLRRLVKFDWRLLLLGVALALLGIVAKAVGPHPEGFPGYYVFLVFMAFLPIVFCFRVVSYLINWRAFGFMSFTLLLVSVVYEATLGVPYGWWRYRPDQMLGYFVTAWSGLPAEAVFLWVAAGFGTVLLFELLRAVLYMDRPVRESLFGEKVLRRTTFSAEYADTGAPRYLDDGIGFPVPAGPYVNTKGDMVNLVVRVDPSKVRALCDRYLNDPVRGDVRYVPFLSVVLATFARMRGYVNRDDGTRVGQLPEGDMVFWIPTIAVREWFGVPIPSHLALFPYRLYVDSPYGLSAGREALGLFKNYAEFEGGLDLRSPSFTMSVLGFETADPDADGRMLPLVSVTCGGARAGGPSTGAATPRTFGDGKECVREAARALRGAGDANVLGDLAARVAEFVIDLVEPSVRCVSLKQFRDVADPSRACLRQVVEIETTVDDFQGGGFLEGDCELRFHPVLTDTLASDLGVVLEGGAQRGVFGFWARARFTMGKGNVIR